jgi:hypothetical protein
MRDNLVFISTGSLASCVPELFGPGRTFDVCIHQFDMGAPGWEPTSEEFYWSSPRPEFYFRKEGEKLETAAKILRDPAGYTRDMLPAYKQYAFLDDDLTVSTETLNKLFMLGRALELPLFQPALARDSYGSHSHLFDRSLPSDTLPGIRWVPFVEIMCPFFSAAALDLCLPTFDINVSGWGIDHYLWPEIVQGRMAVIDRLPVGHYREPARRHRLMRNGLTPQQELWIQRMIFDPAGTPRDPPDMGVVVSYTKPPYVSAIYENHN